MNRILEFSPSQEEAVVSRVLVLVHHAVDEHFPSAHTNRQFTKTVFSEENSEKTAAMRVPADQGEARGFGSDEVTSPGGNPAEAGATIPPPPTHGRAARPSEAPAKPPPPRPNITAPPPPPIDRETGHPVGSKPTRLDTSMMALGPEGPDWVTRITLALLIAGVLLLAYVLFS